MFLDVSVPLMPPPLNWAMLPEMVLLVIETVAATVLDAAAATDAKRKLADRVTRDGAVDDLGGASVIDAAAKAS